LQYAAKLIAYFSKNAYDCIFNILSETVYDEKRIPIEFNLLAFVVNLLAYKKARSIALASVLTI
jgi:hypothetical protein